MLQENISFEDLCTLLRITPDEASENNHRLLHDWCRQHISQDFDGDYAHFVRFVKTYLNMFIPNIRRDNLTANIEALHGMNTVQYAAYEGYHYFLDTLSKTDSPSRLQAPSKGGMTPLHLAAIRGNHQTILALLKLGMDVNIANDRGQLPTHSVLMRPYTDHCQPNAREQIFRALLATCHHPDLADKDQNTTCLLMATYGFDALLEESLSENSARAFHQNSDSRYPIHEAILNNHLQACKILLTIEGVSELTDRHGQTPLHYAAQYGNTEALLQCCMDAHHGTIHDDHHRTPRDLANEAHNEIGMKLLRAQGPQLAH